MTFKPIVMTCGVLVAAGCTTTSSTTDAGDRAAAVSDTDCVRTALITVDETCTVAGVDELTVEQAEDLKQRAESARAVR